MSLRLDDLLPILEAAARADRDALLNEAIRLGFDSFERNYIERRMAAIWPDPDAETPFDTGYDQGYEDGFNGGRGAGEEDGYEKGYDDGYTEGRKHERSLIDSKAGAA